MKLSQYLVDKNECYLNNDCDYKLNYMNISESAQLLSEIHIKFKEMTNELKQATDDLGKNKLNISKSSFLPHSKY